MVRVESLRGGARAARVHLRRAVADPGELLHAAEHREPPHERLDSLRRVDGDDVRRAHGGHRPLGGIDARADGHPPLAPVQQRRASRVARRAPDTRRRSAPRGARERGADREDRALVLRGDARHPVALPGHRQHLVRDGDDLHHIVVHRLVRVRQRSRDPLADLDHACDVSHRVRDPAMDVLRAGRLRRRRQHRGGPARRRSRHRGAGARVALAARSRDRRAARARRVRTPVAR